MKELYQDKYYNRTKPFTGRFFGDVSANEMIYDGDMVIDLTGLSPEEKAIALWLHLCDPDDFNGRDSFACLIGQPVHRTYDDSEVFSEPTLFSNITGLDINTVMKIFIGVERFGDNYDGALEWAVRELKES